MAMTITHISCGGESDDIEKEDHSPVMSMLTGSKKKAWTWDTSVGTYGRVWGNMGYLGGDGSLVGTIGEGEWWGVSNSEEFAGQLDQTDNHRLIGDESMDAYMIFTTDGYIDTYDAKGNHIRGGTFNVVPVENNPWKVANLTTSAGAILWPFEINSYGSKPTMFEVVYLTQNKMTLVYPDGGNFNSLGQWGEATFWHFKQTQK